MNEVRLGLIGLGNIGTTHSKYLRTGKVQDLKLTAVCDVAAAKMDRFPDYKHFTSSEELIRSGEVDAVLIATPHYAHTTIGIDAFENGVHVLVEKPISVHKADCERLIAAHAGTNLKFGAMFQMRTVPVFKRIKKILDSGELGKLLRTNWLITGWYRTEAYYASGGWRATWKGEGGGVLLNQCPHNLDLFQWFCGLPVRVRAFCGWGKYHNIEVEDDVTAYFEYANGATGVFIASTGEAPGTDRLEIVCDRGKLTFENDAITIVRNDEPVSTHSKASKGGFDKPEVWNVSVPVSAGEAGHYVITQNFVNAILHGEPLIAPGEEGIHSVEFANAMIESALTGQTVNIPLDSVAYEQRLMQLIAESKFEKQAVDAVAEDMEKSFR